MLYKDQSCWVRLFHVISYKARLGHDNSDLTGDAILGQVSPSFARLVYVNPGKVSLV
jgi:hypothetical protein